MPNIVRPGRIPLPGQSATGFKPNPWNVQRRYIAPEWEWAFPDHGMPVWEGAGVPREVIPGGPPEATSGTPSEWDQRSDGLALRMREEESDRITVGGPLFDVTGPWTMEVLMARNSETTSGAHHFGLDSTTDSERMYLGEGTSDQTHVKILSDGRTPGESSTLITLGEPFFFHLTYDGNGLWSLFIDGVFEYDVSTATGWVSNLDAIRIGGSSGRADAGFSGQEFDGWLKYISFIGGVAFDEPQTRQRARDPFGPFRPAQQVIVSSPTGATTVIVGQAVETDTAQAVGSAKSQSVGQSTETDSAFSVTAAKTVSVGQSTETDAAQAVTAAKAQAVGLATETDASLAAGAAKAQSVGLSTETDSALAVTVQAGNTISVGQATETDTAQAVSSAKSQSVGQASESDLALSVTPVRVLTLGQASEVDTAQAVDIARTVAAGLAVETDQSLAVQVAKLQTVGQATETDTALAVTIAGAPLTLSGPFTMFGESLERTMTGEALTRTMNSEDADRTMSGEE